MKPSLFKRFKNPPGGPIRNRNIFKWLAFFLRRGFDPIPEIPPDLAIPQAQALQKYQQLESENTLTWLGHVAFIIKINGKVILTDPYLMDYASPIAGLGPKRFVPPGIAIADLPPIDVIVISHNHYDHLDARTLAALPNKSNIHVVAPLCLGYFFERLGYNKIHELDWYQSWVFADITFRSLPAYHYSKRNLFFKNETLWASYAISWDDKKLYFSGDTAYGAMFLDLGRDYGPFDYALISIAAYQPADIMMSAHVTPELAVKIGQELRAKIVVGMHWGTVILSDEPPFEPPKRFQQAALAAQYPAENIWVFKIGETRII